MATLESGFNPTYSENASILTGNPNRVTVEVEDTIDRDFWSDLLEELSPGKEFRPAPPSSHRPARHRRLLGLGLVAVEGCGHQAAAFAGDFFGMGVTVDAVVGIEGEFYEDVRRAVLDAHAGDGVVHDAETALQD